MYFDSSKYYKVVLRSSRLLQKSAQMLYIQRARARLSLSLLSFFEACELACDTIKCAEELRSKLEEIIHNMQEEMRRHR